MLSAVELLDIPMELLLDLPSMSAVKGEQVRTKQLSGAELWILTKFRITKYAIPNL
jgi:hypothetical protein